MVLVKENGTVSEGFFPSISQFLEAMSIRRIKSSTLLNFSSQTRQVLPSHRSGHQIIVRREVGRRISSVGDNLFDLRHLDIVRNSFRIKWI